MVQKGILPYKKIEHEEKRDELSLTLELMSKLYKKTIVGNLSNNSILLEKLLKK